MPRGFRRLIDDIRNPRASKEERKRRIDTAPSLPKIPGFKAPFIVEGAKELAKIFVDIGPEGGNERLFFPEDGEERRFIPYFDKSTPPGS